MAQSPADDVVMGEEEEVFQTQLPQYWDRPYHHPSHVASTAPCASPLLVQLQDAHRRHAELQGLLETALRHLAAQHQAILAMETGQQRRALEAQEQQVLEHRQWQQQQLHAAQEQGLQPQSEEEASEEKQRRAQSQALQEQRFVMARALAEEEVMKQKALMDAQRRAMEEKRVALCQALRENEAKQKAL